jgi:uncharacterized membrane protein
LTGTAPWLDPRRVGGWIESLHGIDRYAQPLYERVRTGLPDGPVRDLLHGTWLGHPLHPFLTDLPIGFWTSAWTLDLVGGPGAAPAAEVLVGLGVAAAVPTIVTGLTDWSSLRRPTRRAGAVHAVANASATALYGASYMARRRGRHGLGVALGMAGAAAATAGGFLGGHLVYERAAGVDIASAAGATGG